MKLRLNAFDLKEEFKMFNSAGDVESKLPPSYITFSHFKREVQEAIKAVGQATYYDWNQDYNKISP